MSATYRLPDSLGGGVCEIVQNDVDGFPSYVGVAAVPRPTPCLVYFVPAPELTPVEPELLPEPPVGSGVWVQPLDFDPVAGIILRRYADGWTAPGAPAGTPGEDWARVCSLSIQPPVLLIPDPAAGAEPSGVWKCQHCRGRFIVDGLDIGVGLDDEVYDHSLSPEDGESAAVVLLAAARAARAS
jgi:hypothetical protein